METVGSQSWLMLDECAPSPSRKHPGGAGSDFHHSCFHTVPVLGVSCQLPKQKRAGGQSAPDRGHAQCSDRPLKAEASRLGPCPIEEGAFIPL